jgi:hypothetical protein
MGRWAQDVAADRASGLVRLMAENAPDQMVDDPRVAADAERIKCLTAQLISLCNQIASDGGERGVIAIEAIRKVQTAKMWCVRAVAHRDS